MTATGASETGDTSRGVVEAPRLVSLATAALVVAPIRIALGVAGLAVARARGLPGGVAFAEFLLGTGALAFAALADPRRKFFQLREEARALPPDAELEPLARTALVGMYPSTLAVSVLAAAALAFNTKLGAVLSGALAGMGLAAAIGGVQILWHERTTGARLYVERRTKALFARPS